MDKLHWVRFSHERLASNESLYVASVPDGTLRAVVLAPGTVRIAGAPPPMWVLTVDHVPFSVYTGPLGVAARVADGLGRDILPDATEQNARRCPTFDEVIDAKMQLVDPTALLGVLVQLTDRPPYMVQATQVGQLAPVPRDTTRAMALA